MDCRNRLGYFISLVMLIGLYLLVISGRLNTPLQGDEWTHLEPYGTLSGQHPPAFSIILQGLSRYLGLFNGQLRIFGIGCFVLTLLLTYLLVKLISQDSKLALLGAGLFALSPLAIQGSLLIEIDNTILTVALMLFFLYFSRCYDQLKIKHCLILGFLFSLALVSKFTTPLALIPALLIFYALKKRFIWAAGRITLIAFVGLGLFLLIWLGFALHYRVAYASIFVRPVDVYLEYAHFSPLKLLNHIIRVALWFGPLLLFLPIMIIFRLKRYVRGAGLNFLDFCMIYIMIVFLGHIFLLAQNHSFPKYFYPLLPVFAASIALFLKELKIALKPQTLILLASLTILIAVGYLFWPADVLYAYNHTLRHNIVFPSVQLGMPYLRFSLPLLSYPLFIGLVYSLGSFLLRDRGWLGLRLFSLALLVVGVSANISLDVLQSKAGYTTNYYYGRRIEDMYKLGAVFEQIKQRHPQGIIVGPEDVYRPAHTERSGYLWNGDIGRDPQALLKAISDKQVLCIAHSLTWNSINTYQQVILRPQVQAALKSKFTYHQVGEYSVWLRQGLKI